MARDIKTNLLADDQMSPAFRAAGRNATKMALDVEGATLKVEKATKAAAAAEQRFGKDALQAKEAAHKLAVAELELAAANDRVKDSADKSSKSLTRGNGALRDVEKAASKGNGALKGFAMAMGRVGAMTASVASLIGPLTTGLIAVGHVAMIAARGVAAMGHAMVAMAPAAAALPAFAAGFALVKGTILMAAPAMAKALHPITAAFIGTAGKVGGKKTMIGGLKDEVGALASRGLPALAKEFVKVNFPMIGQAMKGIAMQTNSVVTQVGRWVNSTAGQSAIFAILQGTLGVTEKLSEILPGVVISFGNMVGRAAGPGFQAIGGLGPMLDRAANAVKRLFDSTSGADVGKGFKAIGTTFGRVKGAIEGVAGKFATFGHMILDFGNWLDKNQGVVKKWSDALAVVGIALGIWVTGPIAVVIGSLTLLANHWDAVKTAVGGAVGAAKDLDKQNRITEQSTNLWSQAVSGVVGWFRDWLTPAMEWVGKKVMPGLRSAMGDLMGSFREIGQDSKYWTGLLKVLGAILIGVIVVAVFAVVATIRTLTLAFRGIEWVLHNVVIPAFWAIAHGAQDATGATLRFFRALPRQIRALFDQAGNWLHDAGSNILKGLMNGARGALSAVGRWASDIGSSIVGAVKKFFGIKSPSTVFAHLGGQLMTGLAHGMLRNNPTQMILKVFGGMNKALTSMVGSGMADVMNLSGKAASALGSAFSGFGGGTGLYAGLSPAESFIVSHESGGNVNAKNPTSTAFGLGQLLLANRQHYGAMIGQPADTTNYTAQLQMMRLYIRERYGSAEVAASFWKAHHWYGRGGVINEPVLGRGMRTGQTYGFGEHGPETVVPGRHLVRADGGGTTVQHLSVTINARTADMDEDALTRTLRAAVRHGRVSTSVIPPGTRP